MMDETQTLVNTAQHVTSKVPEAQTQQGISKDQAEKCFWMRLMASSLMIAACGISKDQASKCFWLGLMASSLLIDAACLFLKATPKQNTEKSSEITQELVNNTE